MKGLRRGCRKAGAVLAVVALTIALCAAYGFLIEPHWLKVSTIQLADVPTMRVIHISDLHYKGDSRYVRHVVTRINALGADLVCVTGDLVEGATHLPGALEILSGIQRPVFGVPGNHDHLGLASEQQIRRAFSVGGGNWLVETNVLAMAGTLEIVGSSGRVARGSPPRPFPARKRILLTHYPDTVHELSPGSFDLILAGHTHGGQVRLPLWNRAVLHDTVAPFDRGLFQTAAGPLHVSPGIGTFLMRVRLFCRPEITVITF